MVDTRHSGASRLDDARTMREQLKVVLDDAESTTFMAFGALTFCALVLYPALGMPLLAIWYLPAAFVSVLRLVHYSFYVKRRDQPGFDLLRCMRINYVLIGLSGLAWGGLPFFYSPDLSVATQVMLILFPIALATAAVPSYAAWPPAYAIFVTPCLVPTIVALLMSGLSGLAAAALPTLFYLGCLIVLGRHFRLRMLESITLRFQNKSLVTSLSRQNEQLESARNLAEAASQAKSDFLARMSHDIRTPMNGVLGMAEVLGSTELDQRQVRLVDTIHTSAQSLLGIVNNLLDISKIEADKLVLEIMPFSLHDLVGEVEALLSGAAEQKDITLHCELGESVPAWFKGDPVRIRQILVNLLSNAIKFTDTGKVELRVDCGELTEASSVLVFEVIDTGVGIPAEKLGEIFNAFSQAEDSTTRRYGGTGLGLAIARQLAELMGGDVSVCSEPGSGSTFRFTARFSNCTEAEIGELASDRSELSSSQEISADHFRGSRLLLVDDSEINQQVAQAMLQSLGCVVDVVDNGLKAVRKLETSRDDYDLVLMDCQMPVMDGFEATGRIRGTAGHETLPIVALTANAMMGDRERCLQAGMTDYLTKPFREADLRKVLLRHIVPATIGDYCAGRHREHSGETAGAAESGRQPKTRGVPMESIASVGTKQPGLDLPALENLRKLDHSGGLLQRVIDAYITSAPQLVGQIRSGLSAGDDKVVQMAAHTLKSSSANVGALRISECAFAIEQQAREKQLEAIAGELAMLDTLMPALIEELQAERDVANLGKSA